MHTHYERQCADGYAILHVNNVQNIPTGSHDHMCNIVGTSVYFLLAGQLEHGGCRRMQ